MPATTTAIPAWARVMPQAARGRRIARRRLWPSGSERRWTRSAHSTITRAEPSKRRAPARRRRRATRRPISISTTTAAPAAMAKASFRRCKAAKRSPRFHDSSGPTAIATSNGTMIGIKVMSKKGGPTETFWSASDIEKQRIERADQHRRGGGGQQQIVEQQPALARDRREKPAALQAGARIGEERAARRRWRCPTAPG